MAGGAAGAGTKLIRWQGNSFAFRAGFGWGCLNQNFTKCRAQAQAQQPKLPKLQPNSTHSTNVSVPSAFKL